MNQMLSPVSFALMPTTVNAVLIFTVKKDGATFWYIIRDTAVYNTTQVGFSSSISVQWKESL